MIVQTRVLRVASAGCGVRRGPGVTFRAARLLLVAALVSGHVAVAATITVNTANDVVALDGTVSLREAILSINSGADVNGDVMLARSGLYGASDAIHFSIGFGAQVLTPAHELPAILKSVTVDGTTQPGYTAAALITIDGGSLSGDADGLLVSSLVTTHVFALTVQHAPKVGIRIAAVVDRIFANNFEVAPQAAAMTTAKSQLATGSVNLVKVTTTQNGSTGIEVGDAGVVVDAQDLVSNANSGGGLLVAAGRVNATGASQFGFNAGGSPIAYGVQVAPGAVLTLAGANGAPIHIDANNGTGLLVRGNFFGTYVAVADNATHGVIIDTTDDPVFPEDASPTINADLAAFEISGNGGVASGALPPGGLTVLRTRATTTSMNTTASGVYMPERFRLQEGPLVATQSRVHDNLGNGVTLGGDATAVCPFLPSGLQCGAVDGSVENTLVYGNQEGIVIQEQDAGQSATVPNLFGNYVTGNSGTGIHVHTSPVGFDANGIYINGNTVGHNGWNSPTCDKAVAETAPQIWFDGPVAAPDALVTACAANLSSATCNLDRAHTCLWNQDIANASGPDPCRPSYLLSTNSCSSNANIITGYAGTGNPDLSVGVLVYDGAWVNAIDVSWIHGGNLIEGSDWSASGVTSFLSDGPSGSEQICTAAVNKCPDHF